MEKEMLAMLDLTALKDGFNLIFWHIGIVVSV